MRIVALIPARAGSKRVQGKNRRLLGGKRLIDWTIDAAKESGVFDRIAICSDEIEHYFDTGCDLIDRKPVTDTQPDIEWVLDALDTVTAATMDAPHAFAILRPTAPFRSAATIRDAWACFVNHQPADSLRAVRFVNEPPQKMWVLGLGGRMAPLLPFYHPRADASGPLVPWHSSPTQSLPAFVVQTAALEIAWTKTVQRQQSISGTSVLSYFMPEDEELDINTEQDWDRAEQIVAALQAPPAA